MIWFLVFFITTEGYGLRTESWGGLGSASVGWFGALQLLLFAISLATVPKATRVLGSHRSNLGAVVLLLAAIVPVYLLVVTLGRVAMGSGIGIEDIFRNLMMIQTLLIYFLFTYLISRPSGLQTALDMLALNSVIAALAILLIIAMEIDTTVVTVTRSDDLTRTFRAIFPSALLVAAGWLLLWSRYLVRGGLITLVAGLVCLFATTIQLHRSALMAIVVVLVLLLVRLLLNRVIKRSIRKLALIGIITSILICAVYFTLLLSPTTFLFAVSAIIELLTLSGNGGHRVLIIANSFRYVLSDTLGLGVGLDWERVEDLGEYLFTSFIAGPTLDSTYANIVIVLGLPGIILFSFLFFSIFLIGNIRLYSRTEPVKYEAAFFLRPFLLYCMVVGLGTDFVLISPNAVTFAMSILVAVRLAEVRIRESHQRDRLET